MKDTTKELRMIAFRFALDLPNGNLGREDKDNCGIHRPEVNDFIGDAEKIHDFLNKKNDK